MEENGFGDDALSQFARPDFDSTAFMRKSIRENRVAHDHAQLKEGIAVLETQLREQVRQLLAAVAEL